MWLENYNNYATNNEVRYSNVVFATSASALSPHRSGGALLPDSAESPM